MKLSLSYLSFTVMLNTIYIYEKLFIGYYIVGSTRTHRIDNRMRL